MSSTFDIACILLKLLIRCKSVETKLDEIAAAKKTFPTGIINILISGSENKSF